MKVRIYPKKATIMSQLEAKCSGIEADLTTAVAHLEKLQNSKLFVAEQELNFATRSVDAFTADIAEIQKLMQVLASHDPPEVMAEIEV